MRNSIDNSSSRGHMSWRWKIPRKPVHIRAATALASVAFRFVFRGMRHSFPVDDFQPPVGSWSTVFCLVRLSERSHEWSKEIRPSNESPARETKKRRMRPVNKRYRVLLFVCLFVCRERVRESFTDNCGRWRWRRARPLRTSWWSSSSSWPAASEPSSSPAPDSGRPGTDLRMKMKGPSNTVAVQLVRTVDLCCLCLVFVCFTNSPALAAVVLEVALVGPGLSHAGQLLIPHLDRINRPIKTELSEFSEARCRGDPHWKPQKEVSRSWVAMGTSHLGYCYLLWAKYERINNVTMPGA